MRCLSVLEPGIVLAGGNYGIHELRSTTPARVLLHPACSGDPTNPDLCESVQAGRSIVPRNSCKPSHNRIGVFFVRPMKPPETVGRFTFAASGR